MNIQSLPKVELHCHLDGIVSPAIARAIRETDPGYPLDPDELQRAYPITDLASFFGWWQYSLAINSQLHLFQPLIQQYIAAIKAQNVRYFEVMIASGEVSHIADTQAAIAKLMQFREWVNQCEGGKIQVEFLLAINRQRSPEWLQSIEGNILALYETGLICGVVLAGPEIGNPVKPFTRSFARFHEVGLRIEIHAGEWVGAESVWDALEYGYPDRIGHGVALFDDPKLVEFFQERQIHIEMCPTSNLQTGSIKRIEDHPIGRVRDLGLNFGINTDDPGVFLCSMESEYQVVTDVFGFTESDWDTVYKNSLAARFQPELRIPT